MQIESGILCIHLLANKDVFMLVDNDNCRLCSFGPS